jgi:transcription initiation factor TFIIIB Brf1 subunit/transcription initiation factor TFIIB
MVEITCEECKSNSIFVDTNNGEVVCKNCGIVQDLFWWKEEIYDK